MRGFSKFPELPTLQELYGLRPAAIATYPMYRGVAKYAGMEVLSTGTTFSEEVDTLGRHLAEYDFFFVHYKYTDSRGEDGDFEAKAKCLEEVDAEIGRLDNLRTDVLVVTGDHSTPATFRAHSWHPVPVMLRARFARVDRVKEFNEFTCAQGGLGRFPTQELMALMLAHAGRLEKFGA
jgi:2,3-bisphosphoglycerate-independent phosphoglycerate mutase